MDFLIPTSSGSTSCQSPRVARFAVSLLLLLCCSVLSCKKEGELITVDAFAQLAEKVTYHQETYAISFSLQDYPYESVQVRLGDNKSAFKSGTGLKLIGAVLVSKGRYGVFLNDLITSTKYYYQILVKDGQSEKVVHSDIYSFTTNP